MLDSTIKLNEAAEAMKKGDLAHTIVLLSAANFYAKEELKLLRLKQSVKRTIEEM